MKSFKLICCAKVGQKCFGLCAIELFVSGRASFPGTPVWIRLMYSAYTIRDIRGCVEYNWPNKRNKTNSIYIYRYINVDLKFRNGS